MICISITFCAKKIIEEYNEYDCVDDGGFFFYRFVFHDEYKHDNLIKVKYVTEPGIQGYM